MMGIPGMNLYAMARTVIGGSSYTWYAVTGRVNDASGEWITTYAAGIGLVDSIQAIDRSLYEKLGLELSKYYIMIYTDNPLLVVERDSSGDQIEFNGERFQLLSNTDWKPQDGWEGVLAVRQTPTTPLTVT